MPCRELLKTINDFFNFYQIFKWKLEDNYAVYTLLWCR